MLVKLSQSEKAQSPMLVQEVGILICVKAEQYSKARAGMVFTPDELGKITLVSERQ